MFLALSLLVAAADPPGPVPIGTTTSWISALDYPADALKAKKAGMSDVEISIDQQGRPARCRVLASSGTASLDDTSCAVLLVRGRWKPTLDDTGQPIFAIFHRRIVWSLPGDIPQVPDESIDVEVYVARLPVPRKQAAVVVRQIQRADGTVESCSVASPSSAPQLNRIACSLADPGTGLIPINNAAGEPVRGVRWRTVQFTEQAAARKPG